MSSQHQRAGEIFAQALEQPEAERSTFVARAVGDDAGLAADVMSLLEFHEEERAPLVDREPPLAAGTLIGARYRLQAPIGAGGMGEVWRAEDTLLGEIVAIKSIDRSALAVPLDELRFARRATHPNLCRVHDAIVEGDRVYLSMELVEGEDLSQILERKGRLPPGEAIDLIAQAAAGLAAAHAAGVFHRDLKPANVLIGKDGRVRLTDFGLAEAAGQVAQRPLVGTPAYMAPELLAGQAASERSEVFALGMVLYEAIAGRTPIETGGLSERLDRLRAGDFPPLSSLANDVTPELERTVRRALAPDPGDRFPSVLEFAGALPGCDPLRIAAVAGVAPPVEVVAAARAGERWPTARIAWHALAVVAALALLAGLQRASSAPRVEAWPPEQLIERAEALLRELGHTRAAGDRAWGFAADDDDRVPEESLFWYRRWDQPTTYADVGGHGHLFADSPPPISAGDATIWLSPRGDWVALESIPRRTDVSADPVLERRARELAAAVPDAAITVSGDEVTRLTGTKPPDPTPVQRVSRGRVVSWIYGWILPVLSVPLGLHHLRSGRGYGKGALRIGSILFLARFAGGMACAHHPGTIAGELEMFQLSLGDALIEAAMAVFAILAVEPIARRYWPDSVLVLSRLLQGRWKDPLVGASLAAGALVGSVWALLIRVQHEIGSPDEAPDWFGLDLGASPLRPVAVVLELIPGSFERGLLALLVLVALRALLRRTDLAAAATAMILAYPDLMHRSVISPATLLIATGWMVAILILVRAGVLAWVVAYILRALLRDAPPLTDLEAWWAGTALLPVVLTLAVAGFGLWLAGRPPATESTAQRT